MDEDLQNIEDLFREGLEDNEEMPSGQVWNYIDKSLDQDNVISIKKKYTSLKRVSLVLLFLLIGLSIYELSNRYTNGANILTSNTNNNALSPHTNKSQQPIDSISVNNTNKGNNVIDNSVVHNFLPDTQRIQPGNNSLIENKTASKNNNIANNNTASKNKQKFINAYSYKIKTNSTEPTEGNLQTLEKNDADKTNQQSGLLKPLNHQNIDKVTRRMNDFIDTKKLTQTNIINKIIPLTIKNTIASGIKNKPDKLTRFSITPFFSPDIAWYHLQEDKPDNQPDSIDEIKKNERHDFSSTLSALIDYKLNKHWALQAGFTYSNINITVNPKTIYAQTDNAGHVQYRINTSSGYGYVLPSFSSNPAVGDSLYAFTSTHTLQYISIPFAAKYNVIKGKFTFNALTGLSVNFLINGKIETTIIKDMNNETEILKNIQGLKKIYFSGLTGLGVEYALSKRMALCFAPTFRFALNSINSDAPVKSYPNSFGFATGLKITL